MRFAYLIMAHENTLVLQTLLKLLDDPRNTIFLHIDAKTNFDFKEELTSILNKSELYILTNRIDVKWAHISQVEAEYALFQESFLHSKYDYYHLISGADLPIKDQNTIHSFFAKNKGKEFIGFGGELVLKRVKYKHLFTSKFRSSNKLIIGIRDMFIITQKLIGYSQTTRFDDSQLKKGTNWVSVTHNFVEYILLNKEYILSSMKFAKSPDEFYKQTLAFNSPFKSQLYSLNDEFRGCMKLIDWKRGKPYVWQDSDYDEIVSSDKLFARKFSDNSKKLIERIKESVSISK